MSDYIVRIVGQVARDSGVAFITTPDGTETRVRWDKRRRTYAYRCDEHGALGNPEECVHGDLVDVAAYWHQDYDQQDPNHQEEGKQ